MEPIATARGFWVVFLLCAQQNTPLKQQDKELSGPVSTEVQAVPATVLGWVLYLEVASHPNVLRPKLICESLCAPRL